MTAASAPAQTEIVNISTQLTEMARRYPDKPAVIHAVGAPPHAHVTFSELETLSARCAAGLARVGITRGMRTIVMVRPSRELFALTFALFKLGAVPVLIDPGMGRKNLVECLASVEAEAFIGIPLAHVLRLLHRRAFRSVRVRVTLGPRWFWGGHTWNDLLSEEPQPEEPRDEEPRASARAVYNTREPPLSSSAILNYSFPAPTRAADTAAILFTSGSTGPAKGVVYTHGIFDAQVSYLREHFGYGPDEIDLASFPLFALFDAALGMTAVIPDMDASRPGGADPRKIADAIQRYRCTHMFGSPALLENLSRYGVMNNLMLSSLRRVITAGAPVRPDLLERTHKILPSEAEIFTPYGATEALPVASIGSREILSETKTATARGGGTCVGRSLRGMTVRIIEITDSPIETWRDATELQPGEIGEIAVSGPVVTREYFRRPEQTAAAKIRDTGSEEIQNARAPKTHDVRASKTHYAGASKIHDAGAAGTSGTDAAGGKHESAIVHRMGDVGYLDARGRLWMCGRKSHRVVTENGTLFTVPCEAIFNQYPAVRRSALVGVGPRGCQRPVICIELHPAGECKAPALPSDVPVVRSSTSHARRFSLFAIVNSLFSTRPPIHPQYKQRLTAELLQLAESNDLTRDIKTVLFHPSFPVDVRHNAKIFREKLALWAEEQLR